MMQTIKKPAIKMVKNAKIFNDNGVYRIIHYETEIFSYNQATKIATIRMNLSQTSNRQIRRALDFFEVEPKNINDLEIGHPKWSYSGDRV